MIQHNSASVLLEFQYHCSLWKKFVEEALLELEQGNLF